MLPSNLNIRGIQTILDNLSSGHGALYSGPTSAQYSILAGEEPPFTDYIPKKSYYGQTPQPPGPEEYRVRGWVPPASLFESMYPSLKRVSGGGPAIDDTGATVDETFITEWLPKPFHNSISPEAFESRYPQAAIPGGPGYPDRPTREELIKGTGEGVVGGDSGGTDYSGYPGYQGIPGYEPLDIQSLLDSLLNPAEAGAAEAQPKGTGSAIMDLLGFDTEENQGRFTDLGDTLIDLGARMMAGESPHFFQNVGEAILGTNKMLDAKEETQWQRDLALAEYDQAERDYQARLALGLGQLEVAREGNYLQAIQYGKPTWDAAYQKPDGSWWQDVYYPDGSRQTVPAEARMGPEAELPPEAKYLMDMANAELETNGYISYDTAYQVYHTLRISLWHLVPGLEQSQPSQPPQQ